MSRARGVFLARALKAVRRLAEEVGEPALAEASAASSDVEVLLRALEAPEGLERLRRGDSLAPARLRGIEARERLLAAEGGCLSGEEVARALGLTRQAVDKRRRANRLIGLSRGRRGYAYPAWQLRDGRSLPGLERVLERLTDHDPWMQAMFFLRGNERLRKRRPLDALREGQVDAVLEAARSYGAHGAA